MTEILLLTSSPRGGLSQSNRLAGHIVDHLRRTHRDAKVTARHLADDPLPHIDTDFVVATRTPDGAQSAGERAMLARSDALTDELLAADIVVIAAAMINFSIPSTLKSWIDYVSRAGKTFAYDENGPKGLATGKRVIVVAARGGVYSGDRKAADFQVPYLLHVLAFLGMTDVEVIEVEGTAFGPEAAEKAFETGLRRAHDIVGARVAA